MASRTWSLHSMEGADTWKSLGKSGVQQNVKRADILTGPEGREEGIQEGF